MTDETARDAPQGLLRVLGVIFGLAVVVGGVIGSGIMRAPGLVDQGLTTEPAILGAWLLVGVVAMISAMPLVEAGASVPLAGGPFPIAERAFGRLAGFVTGWLAWVQYPASSAFIASVFGEYVHRLGLLPAVSDHVLAVGLIVAVAVINWIGTRVSGASQSVASAIKGGFFVLLIGALFLSPRGAPPPPAPHLAAITSVGAAIMAIRLIYQTYAGWDGAIYFSEEVKRPEHSVARATFWGIGLCTLVYVLVNAAALHVLPASTLAGSTLAVGDAAKVAMGPIADTAITLFGLFSLAAIVNLQTMTATRITFRMARHGSLPTPFGRVSPGGTPRFSLAVLVILSVIFAALGDYQTLVKLYSPWTIGALFMVCLSAIRLRFAEPGLARPYKMPLFPWTAILACLIQAALMVLVIWDEPLYGLASILIGFAPIPFFLWLAPRWRAAAGHEFGLPLP